MLDGEDVGGTLRSSREVFGTTEALQWRQSEALAVAFALVEREHVLVVDERNASAVAEGELRTHNTRVE